MGSTRFAQAWRRVVALNHGSPPRLCASKIFRCAPISSKAAAAAASGNYPQQHNHVPADKFPSSSKPPDDYKRQIYCNRALNMKSIAAVGFDMDYTLAQYRPETFESLAYQATVKKLVYNLGYPHQILEWEFDWKYMVRGLVVDKRRGNILKMDRHKYVKVAYHGFQELTREERLATYGNTLSRESFDEPQYALIDTLFSLAEAYLFAQLVELKDAHPELFPFPAHTEVYCDNGVPVAPTYTEIYKDVRAAVDLCHRDGTLKQAVAQDPSKYIYADRQLIFMLKSLRDSGRLTFLVTNSFWDYTHVVMNYLFRGTATSDKWIDYFDLVITGSAKPTFFKDGNPAPLFEVDINTGMLQNTDNGTPIAQVGLNSVAVSERALKVFQGGTVAHLHKLLAIESGSQVLYCGDHIYGDILRSKKQLGWRTMLVVPELDLEVGLLKSNKEVQKEICKLRQNREEIEDELQRLDWLLKFSGGSKDEKGEMQAKVEALQIRKERVQNLHRTMQRDFHEKFHKTWGQLMKAGHQNSRFAHQVERFACLYTSQVTNLCSYSLNKCFRTFEDFMPHELDDESARVEREKAEAVFHP